jgi:hypothetical protein
MSLCNGKIVQSGKIDKEICLVNDYFKIIISRNGTINKLETSSGDNFMKSYHNFNIGAWGEKGICQRSDYSVVSSFVKTTSDSKILTYKIVCGKGKIDEAEIEINIKVNDSPVVLIEYHMQFRDISQKQRIMNFNSVLSSRLFSGITLDIEGKKKVHLPVLTGKNKIEILNKKLGNIEFSTPSCEGQFSFADANKLHGVQLFYFKNELVFRILKSVIDKNRTEASIRFSITLKPKEETLSL